MKSAKSAKSATETIPTADINKIPRGVVLKTDEVCQILRCHPQTLRDMANRGKVPFAQRVGRIFIFSSDGLREWLNGGAR